MNETIPITYTKCGFCTARNHCDACGAELSEALLKKEGVLSADTNIQTKSLQISYTFDRDTLEDLLDGMGILFD